MDAQQDGAKRGRKPTKLKRLASRVDLTALVDLGFLLITFFMLATSLAKPQTMEISMPPRDRPSSKLSAIKASLAMTIIIGKDSKVYYFFGRAEKATEVAQTSFAPNGIRKVLLQRNGAVNVELQRLQQQKRSGAISAEAYTERAAAVKMGRAALVVLIKPSDSSKYEDLVGIMDEMNIANMGKYAILPISASEAALVARFYPNAL